MTTSSWFDAVEICLSSCALVGFGSSPAAAAGVATHSVSNATAIADRASRPATARRFRDAARAGRVGDVATLVRGGTLFVERVGVSADRAEPRMPGAAPCQPKGNGISVLTA